MYINDTIPFIAAYSSLVSSVMSSLNRNSNLLLTIIPLFIFFFSPSYHQFKDNRFNIMSL